MCVCVCVFVSECVCVFECIILRERMFKKCVFGYFYVPFVCERVSVCMFVFVF